MRPRVAAMRSPAKQFTSNLAPGKTVTVSMRDIDRYRRTVRPDSPAERPEPRAGSVRAGLGP